MYGSVQGVNLKKKGTNMKMYVNKYVNVTFFSGPDTKLMQNSGRSTFKRTSVDHLMNILVLCVSLCTQKYRAPPEPGPGCADQPKKCV